MDFCELKTLLAAISQDLLWVSPFANMAEIRNDIGEIIGQAQFDTLGIIQNLSENTVLTVFQA